MIESFSKAEKPCRAQACLYEYPLIMALDIYYPILKRMNSYNNILVFVFRHVFMLCISTHRIRA